VFKLVAGRGRNAAWVAVVAAVLLIWSGPVQALTIVPTWDVTITTDPNAATIMATINAGIAQIQSKFSDPIVVSIKFQTMGAGLGQSQFNISQQTYTNVRAALVADATSPDDALALANLPVGVNNPVDGQPNMWLTYANCRAIGINPGAPPLGFDGIISLNISVCYLNRAHTIGAGPYDLQSVVMHEMDEVLGLGSGLNMPVAFPRYPRMQDLFRYDGLGARSFTTLAAATSYFSIDGKTNIVQFNQNAAGDYGDWIQNVPAQCQDWAGTPGTSPDEGPSELRSLDVIGYDPIIPPPPPPPPPGGGPTGGPGEGSYSGSKGNGGGEGTYGFGGIYKSLPFSSNGFAKLPDLAKALAIGAVPGARPVPSVYLHQWPQPSGAKQTQRVPRPTLIGPFADSSEPGNSIVFNISDRRDSQPVGDPSSPISDAAYLLSVLVALVGAGLLAKKYVFAG
jgi:hypothetical protein